MCVCVCVCMFEACNVLFHCGKIRRWSNQFGRPLDVFSPTCCSIRARYSRTQMWCWLLVYWEKRLEQTSRDNIYHTTISYSRPQTIDPSKPWKHGSDVTLSLLIESISCWTVSSSHTFSPDRTHFPKLGDMLFRLWVKFFEKLPNTNVMSPVGSDRRIDQKFREFAGIKCTIMGTM